MRRIAIISTHDCESAMIRSLRAADVVIVASGQHVSDEDAKKAAEQFDMHMGSQPIKYEVSRIPELAHRDLVIPKHRTYPKIAPKFHRKKR